MKALIGFGQVRHKRFRPRENAFTYSTYFLMLQMRSALESHGLQGEKNPCLSINKRGALSFYDADHGDSRGPEAGGAMGWLQELLGREGVSGADGEIWLHTYPRVWGYAFKPVSFWYCHSTSGALSAIVAEVNNTFGERHFYLIKDPSYGQDLIATKEFHVSPFCEIKGQYRFRFLRTKEKDSSSARTVVRIDYEDALGVLIHTSVSGALEPLNKKSLRKALINYPLLTLMVIYRIHWQALKLWIKKITFRPKPVPPKSLITIASVSPLEAVSKS